MSKYDVIVLGAGFAGMTFGYTAASEGLAVAVIEEYRPGGRARDSMMIRNHPGFPKGITGADLTAQLVMQMREFDATLLSGRAERLEGEEGRRVITLSDGRTYEAPCIVIACGLKYRKLEVPHVGDYIDAGIVYGKASEKDFERAHHVCILGGSNAAGQAAYAAALVPERRVRIIVRGEDLSRMSDYLIREIEGIANIDVCCKTEVLEARGEGKLEELLINCDGQKRFIDADLLQILVGARPELGWLPQGIGKNEDERLLVGSDIDPAHYALARRPLPFETTVPGIFAGGDVRHGSPERIPAAEGDAVGAVQSVHAYRRLLGLQATKRHKTLLSLLTGNG